jgi:cytoskeleton protein RodZ
MEDNETAADESAVNETSQKTENTSPAAITDAAIPEIGATTESAAPVDQLAELDRLELEFSDECWLEVSDAQGDVLATDLQRPGSRLTLIGKRPFQVKLGFAAAASIKLNGEPVAIAPQAGVKVLTLNVGE